MNEQVKAKLEKSAKDYVKPFRHQLHLGAEEGLIMDLVGFAQTILENPGKWGLVHPHSQKLAEEVLAMESQLTKYREALEDVINNCEDGAVRVIRIAKEALKQEANND